MQSQDCFCNGAPKEKIACDVHDFDRDLVHVPYDPCSVPLQPAHSHGERKGFRRAPILKILGKSTDWANISSVFNQKFCFRSNAHGRKSHTLVTWDTVGFKTAHI
jgi:hypothetical protein